MFMKCTVQLRSKGTCPFWGDQIVYSYNYLEFCVLVTSDMEREVNTSKINAMFPLDLM